MRSVPRSYLSWAALFCCPGLTLVATALAVLFWGGNRTATALVAIIGDSLFLFGIYILAQGWIFGNKKRRLIAQGKYVYAEILGFPLDSFLSGKEHPVYQMLCSYKDPATGKEYLFHDGGIALSLDERVATKKVRVYTDPEGDFSDYYIDVASCISVQNEDS